MQVEENCVHKMGAQSTIAHKRENKKNNQRIGITEIFIMAIIIGELLSNKT